MRRLTAGSQDSLGPVCRAVAARCSHRAGEEGKYLDSVKKISGPSDRMGSRRPFFPDGFSEIVEDIKDALFKEGQFEDRQDVESGLPTFTVLLAAGITALVGQLAATYIGDNLFTEVSQLH